MLQRAGNAHADPCSPASFKYVLQGTYDFNAGANEAKLNAPNYIVLSTTDLTNGSGQTSALECQPQSGNLKITKDGDPGTITIATYSRVDWADTNFYATGAVVYRSGNVYTATDDHTADGASAPGTGGSWNDHWELSGDNVFIVTFNQTDINNYILEDGDTAIFEFNPVIECVSPQEGTYPDCSDPPPPTGLPDSITPRDAKLIGVGITIFVVYLISRQFRYRP